MFETRQGDEELIQATPEHPFMLKNGQWMSAGQLTTGDMVQTAENKVVRLKSIATDAQRQEVHNFEVADFHTYFVGEAGVWVHNTDCGGDKLYLPDQALAKQRVNGQDIPLPLDAAEGRPHTVLGSRVGSDGQTYRQSAEFTGETWPKVNNKDVPLSEVHWSSHNRGDHINPHQHVFEYDGKGWIRQGGNGIPFNKKR